MPLPSGPMVSEEKSEIHCYFNCYCFINSTLFLSSFFNFFPLFLVYRSIIVMCPDVDLFFFSYLGFSLIWNYRFMYFTKVGRFSTIISLIIFFGPTSSSAPLTLIIWILYYRPTGPWVSDYYFSVYSIVQIVFKFNDSIVCRLQSTVVFIQWGFKFGMLYFSVLQFSFDSFFYNVFLCWNFFHVFPDNL